jgi:hypothetical protein
MATRMLEHLADEPDRLQIAMDAAGNAMLGGADTVGSDYVPRQSR